MQGDSRSVTVRCGDGRSGRCGAACPDDADAASVVSAKTSLAKPKPLPRSPQRARIIACIIRRATVEQARLAVNP